MKPSVKAKPMRDFLDSVSLDVYGITRTEAIESNICVDCHGPATEFVDQLSRKEYSISGLCQECQDKIF